MHVKATNGTVDTYPYSVGQLRRDNPKTSFPKRIPDEMLSEWGVYPVANVDPPAFIYATQNLTEGDPVLVAGQWQRAWVITDATPEEVTQRAAQHIDSMHAAINAERDRRLAADFTFNGKQFQRDATSLARITGAATLAGFAVAQGSPAGNLRWANPARDFEWIASDDTRVPMDAQTAFDFGAAAARVETTLVFAGSALRAMSPIPADFTDDKWWT